MLWPKSCPRCGRGDLRTAEQAPRDWDVICQQCGHHLTQEELVNLVRGFSGDRAAPSIAGKVPREGHHIGKMKTRGVPRSKLKAS